MLREKTLNSTNHAGSVSRAQVPVRRTPIRTVPLLTSSKTHENSGKSFFLEVSSASHVRRHGSVPPVRPRPRSGEHTRCTDKSSDLSQRGRSMSSPSSIRTRAQLLRPRLESPARRRNSSAEWPGPSNGTSIKRVSSCAIASSNPTALRLPQSQLRSHVRKLLL